MKPIAGYDARGNLISGEEIEKRRQEITGEIMQVLEKHDLTIGQALRLLNDCVIEINACSYQPLLKEALQHLKSVRQQDE